MFQENPGSEITWLSPRHRFRKATSTSKHKASVFKFLGFEDECFRLKSVRFRDELLWTEHLASVFCYQLLQIKPEGQNCLIYAMVGKHALSIR